MTEGGVEGSIIYKDPRGPIGERLKQGPALTSDLQVIVGESGGSPRSFISIANEIKDGKFTKKTGIKVVQETYRNASIYYVEPESGEIDLSEQRAKIDQQVEERKRKLREGYKKSGWKGLRENSANRRTKIANELRDGKALTREDIIKLLEVDGNLPNSTVSALSDEMEVGYFGKQTGLKVGTLRYRGNRIFYDSSLPAESVDIDNAKIRIDELMEEKMAKRKGKRI
jgi:hypothetical protein